MRKFFSILLFVYFISLNGQDKVFTRKGNIKFFSETIVEDIKAENNAVLSIINTSNGEMAIAMQMNQFVFPKKLMQEHFNENYIESEKYPKSTFKGIIAGFSKVKKYKATETYVEGTMTIHGVARDICIPTTLTKKDGSITMSGKFIIKLKDYQIKIPRIVIKNIAEEIEVSYNFIHLPHN